MENLQEKLRIELEYIFDMEYILGVKHGTKESLRSSYRAIAAEIELQNEDLT